MGFSLADTVLFSEKRRKMLLHLNDEPGGVEELTGLLSLSSASIQANARILKKANLLVEENGIYRLSDVAGVIAEQMKELLEVLAVLEENRGYWKDHDLTPIPSGLLKDIRDLGRCELLEPDVAHMAEIPEAFLENMRKSKRASTFVSYFHPEAPSLYAGLAEKEVALSLCMTETVFERFSRDFPEEVEKILAAQNSKLLVCREKAALPEIVATDRFMALRLFEKNGKLRNQLMMSRDAGSLQWGQKLYEHYESMSEQVNRREPLQK